jgi:hypothetical protein
MENMQSMWIKPDEWWRTCRRWWLTAAFLLFDKTYQWTSLRWWIRIRWNQKGLIEKQGHGATFVSLIAHISHPPMSRIKLMKKDSQLTLSCFSHKRTRKPGFLRLRCMTIGVIVHTKITCLVAWLINLIPHPYIQQYQWKLLFAWNEWVIAYYIEHNFKMDYLLDRMRSSSCSIGPPRKSKPSPYSKTQRSCLCCDFCQPKRKKGTI